MAMNLTNIIKWKHEEGYDYVYVDEYSGSIIFLKETELEDWFRDQYKKYCSEMKSKAVPFSTFCEHNQPDRIIFFSINLAE